MEKVKQGDTVKVHYTGRLNDGTIFDSSKGRDPLEFKMGSNQIIAGFEKAVVGMEIGESKTVDVPSTEAYGPRSKELVQEIDRSKVPPDLELEVGQQLQMTSGQDQKVVVTVTDLSDQTVTLDANHPLAGQDLSFEIELVEIQ